MVRTITFRVSVKAADYEAALKPEVWPYRVAVRHFRAPRRPDRADSGWRGQSRQSGGNITSDTSGNQNNVGGRHPGNRHQLPPGHPGRVGAEHQLLGPRQPGPVEMSNFWNTLHTLGASGGDVGLTSPP